MPTVSFVPLRILPGATFTFPACPNCKTKVLRVAPNLLSCPRCRSHYPDAKMALRFRVRATVLCGALQTKVTLFGGRLNAVFGMTARALETLLAATDALPNTGLLDALAHILVGTRIEACVSAKFMKRYKPSQLGPAVLDAAQLASACSGGGGGTLVGLAEDALINSFRVLNVRCTVLDLLCLALSGREEQHLSRGIGRAARSSYRKVANHAPAHKWDFGGQSSSVISNTLPENYWPESWLKLDCPLVFETVPVERYLTEELKLNLVQPVLPSDSAVLLPAAEPVEACAPNNPVQVDPSDSLASQLNGLDLNDDDNDESVPESPELVGYAPVTQQSVTQAMSAMSLQDDTLNDDNDDESVPSSPELIGIGAVAARQTVAQGDPHKPIQDDMLAMLLDGLNLDNDKYTQTQPTQQPLTQRTQRTHASSRRTVPAPAPSQDTMLAVLLDGFSLNGDETFMVDAGAAPRAAGGNHRAQTTAGGNAPSQRKGDFAASQTFYGTQTFYGDDSDLAALVDRLTLDGQDGF
ncbi:hypothetical protein HDU89_001736 [Geranomyces variabilis]|nr:hypothetical protein HDU89_001736 [Geranomyces variabilis]